MANPQITMTSLDLLQHRPEDSAEAQRLIEAAKQSLPGMITKYGKDFVVNNLLREVSQLSESLCMPNTGSMMPPLVALCEILHNELGCSVQQIEAAENSGFESGTRYVKTAYQTA